VSLAGDGNFASHRPHDARLRPRRVRHVTATTGSRRPVVTHCIGFYFPSQVGGSEVYVQSLIAELGRQSIDGQVVAATDGGLEQYDWQGVRVTRYPSNWADVSPSVSTGGTSRFQELILRDRPDIFHLHSWTSGAGLVHLGQVAQLGIPCVVTMHVPSALCLRGTMLLHGREACDGRIDDRRCTQCWAESRGLPGPLAWTLSRLPARPRSPKPATNFGSRVSTLLSTRLRVAEHAGELHRMAALSERVVVPSAWVGAGLEANGVDAGKIVLSRQGVTSELLEQAARSASRSSPGQLSVGYIGRLEDYKGAHVLLEAVAGLPPDVPVRVLVAGTASDPRYMQRLKRTAARDRRIELVGSVERGDVPVFLRKLDVLAVPSNYMETGPLVVLEAQAFGLPVMGARLGGISERIRDGVDGWLLPPEDTAAWAAAISAAALDRNEVKRRAGNVAPVRTMAQVAQEMADLYREILGRRA
jgi:glycosyltransferase involved in cell wall biosynthesis